MPAERTPKTLKQTTLFNFAKPVPRPIAVATPQHPPSKPSQHDHELEHVSEADEADAAVGYASSGSLKRAKTVSKPVPVPKPKPKPKGKAGDDDRSLEDVILCIKPEFTKLIAERRKNHEYRKYKLKDSVTHLWLYETAPTSAITYVMTTTTPKVPGEVNDPTGVGNDDFDQGLKESKYGYPVVELFRLKTPLTTSQLKERFDIATPQGWRYATRKLVEELPLTEMKRVF
ncbi:hypothetical protein GSI_04412 [Ganoderma sinense ZZ0214-1]|uniref:Uncharacterized protein n=1 Tax=Ganoderma sinense ZZ0214-1 TaxID=1077348 RepID=A0A2G8SJ97_9APHY|nr:hypothetical protein GSI_04412 [Ganoderma sinense ZZ0214-1]